MTEEKNPNHSRKAQWGWAMFDWANSVYSLTITTAIFPVYFHAMARKVALNRPEIEAADASGRPLPEAVVSFMGFEMKSVGLLSLSLVFSFIFISLVSPLLSGIADYSGSKKKFMMAFSVLGSGACAMMYFFTANTFYLGFWMFVLASVGYAGGIIFNDAFLPEVADEDQYDRLSARAYALGYIGSVLLLMLNLAMVMYPETFFTADGRSKDDLTALASRVSFLSVGIWWFGFALWTYLSLRDTPPPFRPSNYLSEGYREVREVAGKIRHMPALKRFLLAYFCYNLALQTVMYMASSFGTEELKMKSEEMIISVLLIQFIGIGGSFFFAWLSAKAGNFTALLAGIIFWILLLPAAWFVKDANGFYLLGAGVGLVMGGMQALGRATYSKLLPETTDTASFFSFFAVTDKLSVVAGIAIFGLVSEHFGIRQSILFLAFFFILGGLLLLSLRSAKMKAFDSPTSSQK